MFTTIMEHIEIVKGLEGLQWKELLGFSNDALLSFVKKIDTEEKKYTLQQFPAESTKKLVNYPEFIPKIIYLLKAGISIDRMSTFIQEADGSLLDCSCETLENALKIEEISNRNVATYLKYYSSSNLTKKECGILNRSLEFLQHYCTKNLEEFPSLEKDLLLEPIFGDTFLSEAVKEDSFFQDLRKAKVLELIKYLSDFSLPVLTLTQYQQLVKHAERLFPLLKKITGKLRKDIQIHFLERWLENEQLLFDLTRIEKQGWTSQENLCTKLGYIQEVYQHFIREEKYLEVSKERLIIYAIKYRKRHFLKLYEEHTELFLGLPYDSILFQETFYSDFVNLNTLNLQNLKDCAKIRRKSVIRKEDMKQKEYTFAEVKLLYSCMERAYIWLYHKLKYTRVDERLRVMAEVVNKAFLRGGENEEEVDTIAAFLSEKSLSQWTREELQHISRLEARDIRDLFLAWKEIARFLPEVKTSFQLRYLIENKEKLKEYQDFQSVYADILKNDPYWKWMKQTFKFSDGFVLENQQNIRDFLAQGGSEILYQFYETERKEPLRRLLAAEFMGKFKELKYHDSDLEKEIAFPVSESLIKTWEENLQIQKKEWKIWEEDRFLPVMQIGEIPEETCLSYRTGRYRKCLLSCFDSNKKILYLSYQNRIVLRAILRLTKASEEKMEKESKEFEFVDFTAQTPKAARREQIILFLERAYVKGVSAKQEQDMWNLLFHLAAEKAKKLGIPLMISDSYYNEFPEGQFQEESRYIYISATKGKEQYLDSLGGNHGIASTGRYVKTNVFLLIEKEEKLFM